MADIDDRWFRRETDPITGEKHLVRTERHGIGKRYRARWRDDQGQQRAKSFHRKRDARDWLARVATDLSRGVYVDPAAGKVRLEEYGRQWLAALTSDPSSREAVELRLRLHVFPALGVYELRAIKPSVVKSWLAGLADELAVNTTRAVFGTLSMVLNAAVDDGLIGTNPCRAKSVKAPSPVRTLVVPWPVERVTAVRAKLPSWHRELVTPAAGAGLRQGEVFGLSPEDIDRERRVIHVRRQVKIVKGRLVFAPPKGGKSRSVPLSETVARRMEEHARVSPARKVTLPWRTPTGEATTVALAFTTRDGKALNRNHFNHTWKRALRASGVPATRENGMHALRHFFASVVLNGGASIRDLAEWLGHDDPGFTLRVYVHLMPNSADRLRIAVDQALA